MPQQLNLILYILLISQVGITQNPQENNSGIRIMFYNVENLFYPIDDPNKADDEFTQEGLRYWSFKRYNEKINKIGKVALAIGEWDPPAVIGLCEIESIECLKDLIYQSPLKKYEYEIAFFESDDNRGIDVAMLYRPKLFQLIYSEPIKLKFPDQDSRPTRDILYVKGITNFDTLHLFVNHWPSRYGGQLATLPKRNFAAQVLRSKIDSISQSNKNSNILAMGDFNDHPTDESMSQILQARKLTSEITNDDLLNTIWQYEFKKGTHKYQYEWGILDQFVINQTLLDSTNKLYTTLRDSRIFESDFLLEEDKDGIGKRPKRTYIGFKYYGGYSDHLPIYIDLHYK